MQALWSVKPSGKDRRVILDYKEITKVCFENVLLRTQLTFCNVRGETKMRVLNRTGHNIETGTGLQVLPRLDEEGYDR